MVNTFIGRQREMAELRAGLEAAIAGHGRLFLVSGEPGVGKTSLAEEFSSQAAAGGARVYWARSWEGDGAPVYWPIVQILRGCAGRDDFPQAVEALGDRIADLAALVPELIRQAPRSEEAAGAERSDLQRTQFRLFDAVVRLLRTLAGGEPMILIIDDLHDADSGSLQMLRLLARSLKDVPVLMIGTHREAEVERSPELRSAIAALAREGSHLPLSGLSRADAAVLVRTHTGNAPAKQFAAMLHRTTRGNPLFLNGVVQMLASAGKLEHPDRLTAADLKLPANVRGAIKARLDGMSSKTSEIVTLAAVAGNEFELELLERVSGSPRGDVLERVDEAVTAGVIGRFAGTPEHFRFEHALIRETIYDAIAAAERAGLHRRIAEGIEELYAQTLSSHLPELAHHYAQASPSGTAEKAIDYATRAGEAAYALFAYDEARAQWKTALGLADRYGARPITRAGLLHRLGDYNLGSGPQAIEYLEAAAPMFEAAKDYRRAALVHMHLGSSYCDVSFSGFFSQSRASEHLRRAEPYVAEHPDSEEAREFYLRLAENCRVLLNLDEGIAAAGRAMEICKRMHDPGRWAMGATLLGWFLVHRGSVSRGLHLHGLARRRSDGIASTIVGSFVTELGGSSYESLWDPLEAKRWYAYELLQPRSAGLASGSVGHSNLHYEMKVVCERAGDLEEARKHASEIGADVWTAGGQDEKHLKWLSEGFDIWKAAGAREREFICSFELGGIFHGKGDYQRALEYYEHATSVAVAAGDAVFELNVRPSMALAHTTTGALPAARSNLDRCQEILAAGEDWRGNTGAVARAEAVLAAAQGRRDDTEREFQRAISIFHRYSLWIEEAGTLSAWGWALASAGKHQRADEKFDTAIGIYRRIGAGQHWIDGMLAQKARATGAAQIAEPSNTQNDCVFCSEGEYWTIAYEGKTSRLKDARGLHYIAYLLAHPGKTIRAQDLAALGQASAGAVEPAAAGDFAHSNTIAGDLGDAGELLDAHAKASYQRRLKDLRDELEEARELGNDERAERAQAEIDALAHELKSAIGLRGRRRHAKSSSERARAAITLAIKRALSNINQNNPALGKLLSATIRTGASCSYVPDERFPVFWKL